MFKIAVASGKGGTGKTTVSVSLFHYLTKQGDREVCLVDCDVEEPNDSIFFPDLQMTGEQEVFQTIPVIDPQNCSFCRNCESWCEFNAIVIIPPVKFAEINASLCHSCGACTVACTENAITEKRESIGKITDYVTDKGFGIKEGELKIGSAMQTMLISALKSSVSNTHGFIIYDAPPGTSCPVVETINDADYVVLVTEPTPFGLHDLKLMVDLLKEVRKPFGVIVNKSGLGSLHVYRYLEVNNIDLLGDIPYNEEFASCYATGNILRDIPLEIRESYGKILEKISNNARLDVSSI